MRCLVDGLVVRTIVGIDSFVVAVAAAVAAVDAAAAVAVVSYGIVVLWSELKVRCSYNVDDVEVAMTSQHSYRHDESEWESVSVVPAIDCEICTWARRTMCRVNVACCDYLRPPAFGNSDSPDSDCSSREDLDLVWLELR